MMMTERNKKRILTIFLVYVIASMEFLLATTMTLQFQATLFYTSLVTFAPTAIGFFALYFVAKRSNMGLFEYINDYYKTPA